MTGPCDMDGSVNASEIFSVQLHGEVTNQIRYKFTGQREVLL